MEASSTKVRVLDQYGRRAYQVDDDEARRLIRQGYGIGLGTKKRLRAVRLTVPLAILAGQFVSSRPLTIPQTLGRTRYTKREHIGERWYIFQHKRIGESLRQLFCTVRDSILTDP